MKESLDTGEADYFGIYETVDRIAAVFADAKAPAYILISIARTPGHFLDS